MKNIFDDLYQARKTLREIKILRKLSRIPNNLFTTNLLDIILPIEVEEQLNKLEENKYGDETGYDKKPTDVEMTPSLSDNFQIADDSEKSKFGSFNYVFLVMELIESDMKKLLN